MRSSYRAIFLTLTAVTFFGLSGSASMAQSCEASCQIDCKALTGQLGQKCLRQCMAGRCQNQGIINAAEITGEAGITCAGDGVCNDFCPLGSDPDCIPFFDRYRDGLMACLPVTAPAPDIVEIAINSEIIPSFFVVLNLSADNSCALEVCGNLNDGDFDPAVGTEFIFNDGPVPAFCADLPRVTPDGFGVQDTSIADPLNLGRTNNGITISTIRQDVEDPFGWVQHLFLETDPTTAIYSRASILYRYR